MNNLKLKLKKNFEAISEWLHCVTYFSANQAFNILTINIYILLTGQVHYVKKQLRAFETMQREPGVLAKFTENYLRRDGLFLLR